MTFAVVLRVRKSRATGLKSDRIYANLPRIGVNSGKAIWSSAATGLAIPGISTMTEGGIVIQAIDGDGGTILVAGTGTIDEKQAARPLLQKMN